MDGTDDIRELAAAVGLAERWRDAEGLCRTVAIEDLADILRALGYPAESAADRRRSRERLAAEGNMPPVLLTGDVGRMTALPASLAGAGTADILFEQGGTEQFPLTRGRLPAIGRPGYHRLDIMGREIGLAIAPGHCRALHGGPFWGPSVQIPALRGAGAFGTFDDLAEAGAAFAEAGADLLAISPVHALFPGPAAHVSPYAPSSRLFLNSALAVTGSAADEASDLIDWQQGLSLAHERLEALAAGLRGEAREALHHWTERHPGVWQHAVFDALCLYHGGMPWPRWAAEFRATSSETVHAFAQANPGRIEMHLLGQMMATHRLAAAQRRTRQAGMAVGLIADLAVGVHPGGSEVWANPGAFLHGLSIGAPPDPLGPVGQHWGLTTFSPAGLREQGFGPWISVLRAAMRHAGGLRIDHAFGLRRLWVIADGRAGSRGAYLDYPLEDMMRILTLESWRNGAIVIGEDLGTAPPGFAEQMKKRAIPGMRVLWFERRDGDFMPPDACPRESVAMTGTHDTPTVAGWWRGRDLEWARRIHPDRTQDAATEMRRRDRARLWARIGEGAQPADDQPGPVVDAAIRHVAATPARLKILPLDDILALEEQPNVPGTLDEHPNWRRRYPAPVPALLKREDVRGRLAMLRAHGRPRAGK